MKECPIKVLLPNSNWELIDSDATIQCSGNKTVGTSIEAGLPNITGNFFVGNVQYQSGNEYGGTINGAFTRTNANGVVGANWTAKGSTYNFDASRSSSIYGKSTTVQPKAFVVNIWKRIS